MAIRRAAGVPVGEWLASGIGVEVIVVVRATESSLLHFAFGRARFR